MLKYLNAYCRVKPNEGKQVLKMMKKIIAIACILLLAGTGFALAACPSGSCGTGSFSGYQGYTAPSCPGGSCPSNPAPLAPPANPDPRASTFPAGYGSCVGCGGYAGCGK